MPMSRVNVGRIRARIKELEEHRDSITDQVRDIESRIDELQRLLKEVANVPRA